MKVKYTHTLEGAGEERRREMNFPLNSFFKLSSSAPVILGGIIFFAAKKI
jgi:hypothetical protein